MSAPQVYLASSSPRRRALLDQIGVAYEAFPVSVDESRRPGEASEVYALRLALEKARAGLSALGGRRTGPVLAADTAVVVDDDVLGKPAGRDDALMMLARLSGRSHHVLTAVALVDGEREATRLNVSRVTFRDTTPEERAAYWATGEPADKAGGYAIQGRAAVFVTRLEGSFSGVMGLPLFETAELLREFGIQIWHST